MDLLIMHDFMLKDYYYTTHHRICPTQYSVFTFNL